jgi:site-specific DNA-methyltransferase (adenine-specific)
VKIIEKKVEELIPYVNNPRNNEAAVDFVAASIKEFGFKNPIIIDKDGVIVAGHTRHAAAKKLGLESVPCIMADDLTEQQIKAFRLADNKTAELATWDLEKLEIELEAIGDLEMTDFGFEELEDSGDVVEVIEDEVPDVPEEPKSKLGDIFKLGRHRLICGDSTDPKTLEILMGGGRSGTSIHRPALSIRNARRWNTKTRKKYETDKAKRSRQL